MDVGGVNLSRLASAPLSEPKKVEPKQAEPEQAAKSRRGCIIQIVMNTCQAISRLSRQNLRPRQRLTTKGGNWSVAARTRWTGRLNSCGKNNSSCNKS